MRPQRRRHACSCRKGEVKESRVIGDCRDCRHYASGSAVVTARLFRHATDPETFKAWLDYVDTYLAVWVMGYEKGENLSLKFVDPPSRT